MGGQDWFLSSEQVIGPCNPIIHMVGCISGRQAFLQNTDTSRHQRRRGAAAPPTGTLHTHCGGSAGAMLGYKVNVM